MIHELSEAGLAPPFLERLFLREPGWKVGHKVGSTREFCYTMAPGQDFYHRILDGELFLHNHEERLCLACAGRRGLLSAEPKGLREQASSLEIEPESGSVFDLRGLERSEGPAQ